MPPKDKKTLPIADTPINWSARIPAATQVDANGKIMTRFFFVEAKAASGAHNKFLIKNKKF